MVKVSFIIIGYNIEKYLFRCFSSVQDQTLKDIEIIFVDDGSTDDTYKIVSQMAKKDIRIKVITQKNSGANAARKNGFNNATGEYVVFVDGDDWVEEKLAERLYEVACKNKYDIISFGHYFAFDDHKKKADILCSGVLEKYDYLDNIIISKLSHNLWNKFYNREFLVKAGFDKIPSITMGDDLVANVYLGVYKPRVLILKEYFYNYYHRNDSVTLQISPKILEIQTTINEIERVLKENNLYNKYNKQVEYVKFHEFFILVVKNRHKKTYIQKELYDKYKAEKISIKENEICTSFIKSISILERSLLYLYLFNYELGYRISRLYIAFRRKK